MTRLRSRVANQDGFALIYLAATLATLLIFTGLAVDSGRAYVAKAQLSKAVDGAALAAARALNSGNPRGAAAQVFKANFPAGYVGTSSVTDPTTDPNFFATRTDAASGVNVVTVTASAVLPTTFMKVANYNNVTVSASAEATRRMVDLSLVLDVSSSIGSKWATVASAVGSFVNSFDGLHDRVSLLTFGNGAKVLDAMPSSRGFDKSKVISDIPSTLPGGSTNMVEGLYRGWDELRTVPAGSQSGLRIIVLFTDGASNGVPGNYGAGFSQSIRTWDFPQNANDPDSQTHQRPHSEGLYETQSGNQNPTYSFIPTIWNSTETVPGLPLLAATSWHTFHRSSGIPTQFPLQSSTLTVNGAPQNSRRGLRDQDVSGRYPTETWNINNAARNLVEIVADAARNDTGDYKIRIYTIGMGYLVQDLLGTMPEMPEDILKRISNDPKSPDHNPNQLDGKYFYAPTVADVAPAFQGIQNQILRLSK
jgi:Flp pilus assembly protein TadG